MDSIVPYPLLFQNLFSFLQNEKSKVLYEIKSLDPMDTFFTIRSPQWIYYLFFIGILYSFLKKMDGKNWDISFLIGCIILFYIFYINQLRKDNSYLNDVIHRLYFIGNIMYGPGDVLNIFTMDDYEKREFYNEDKCNYFGNYPRILVFMYDCRNYFNIHPFGYKNTLLKLNEFCKLNFLVENDPTLFWDKSEILQRIYFHMHEALDHFHSIYYNLDPRKEIIEKHQKSMEYLQKILWSQYIITKRLIIRNENYQDITTFTYYANNDDEMAQLNDLAHVDKLHFGTYSK